jgi:branched-chain amino acid transport system ATP-binding protein
VALLEAVDITMRFGGVVALNQTSVDVDPGLITGLIGPNGAGKTTLFNVVTGLQTPTAGRVLLDGTEITGLGVHSRARLGIARTFQRLEAFNRLSARDNVLVAAEMRRRWDRQAPKPRQAVDEILERVGLSRVADVTVGTLSTGTARLVELARALACGPRVLLLDEPSSGLDESESGPMGQLLRELAHDGLAVLLVEHDMAFVMGLCSRIHVLDFGEVIAVGTPAEVQADPKVRAAYLGGSGDGVAA